jgi:hypothetical protein
MPWTAVGFIDMGDADEYRYEFEHGPEYPKRKDTQLPDVVTICGSMKFFPQMLEAAANLTAQGHIVLAPFSVVAPKDQDGEFKAMLDRLHFQKIDMASRIVVVTDQNGYIGESTRREMAYAASTGKAFDVQAFDVPGDRGVGSGH